MTSYVPGQRICRRGLHRDIEAQVWQSIDRPDQWESGYQERLGPV